MDKVVLVNIAHPSDTIEDLHQSMSESVNLVNTYGGVVIVKRIQKKQNPDYKTYVGSGKLLEIFEDTKKLRANIVIINNILKAKQIWNIDEFFFKNGYKVQVWDRMDLILKIFAKHATTSDSKIQIELASIKHMGPRIFGMGLQLSRQGGGIGTRGAGETNIEMMKRHLGQQEIKIKKKLRDIQNMREHQRKSRQRKNIRTVSIVGYTNAGKSHLLHSLTKKNIKIKDELFATLDTRVGESYLPNLKEKILISDTIGFIKDLPPSLIDAFKSTLEETIHADILLHVIDVSDPYIESKIDTVDKILSDLQVIDKPVILVFNKIDLIRNKEILDNITKRYDNANANAIFISAMEKIGIKELIQKIEEMIIL